MAGGSKLAVVAALVGNLVIAVAKLAGGLVSRSAAMLAESAHSFSDVGNQVLLLVGIRRSQRPPTERHPFGQGKSAYFWPFLVAVLLFGAAGGYSLVEGIRKMVHPHPVEDIRLSLGILGGAFLIEIVSLGIAVRAARVAARASGTPSLGRFLRETKDASLLTILVEDALALAGLPIAAAGLILSKLTGSGAWDGGASVLIGVMLMGFALFLGKEVHDLLLGEAVSRGDLSKVRQVVARDGGAVRLEDVKTMHLGPDSALLAATVVMAPGLDTAGWMEALERLEGHITQAVPALRHVYLEPRSS